MKLNKKSIIMIFCAILSLTAGIGLRFYNALHSTSSDILKEVQKILIVKVLSIGY